MIALTSEHVGYVCGREEVKRIGDCGAVVVEDDVYWQSFKEACRRLFYRR